jgi:transposase
MGESIGLDVSLTETAISVRRDGKRIWRGKCPSEPSLIAEVVRQRAPEPQRVVFETGPLSVWFYHALQAEGLPAICIDARHAKAALDMAPNKTDANDANGLAHLAEVGFYRAVRVKSYDSMLVRTGPVSPDHDRVVQPDPWAHEDVRAGRAAPQRRHVRS